MSFTPARPKNQHWQDTYRLALRCVNQGGISYLGLLKTPRSLDQAGTVNVLNPLGMRT